MIFDALVIGESSAAMLSAAMLARKELQVAWVVSPFHGMNPDGEVKNPVVPCLAWDLLPSRLVNEVLTRLGVPYKHLEKSEREEAGIQFVCPEFRTVPVSSPLSFKEEIQRIFGLKSTALQKVLSRSLEDGKEDLLSRFWPALFGKGGKQKTPALSFLPLSEKIEPAPLTLEGGGNAALNRLFELIVYSQTYLSRGYFPKTLQGHFVQNFLQLNVFARGGLVSPERIVQEVFSMAGGTLFVEEEKARLEPHQQKGISLWLKDEEVVNGSVCLASVEPETISRMCEGAHIPKKWLSPQKDPEDSFGMASIAFTISPAGLPGGMGERVIVYLGDASSPFTVKDLMFLSFDRGKMGLEMTGVMTVFYKKAPPENEKSAWAKNQIKRLEGLFPYMPAQLKIKNLSFPASHQLFPETYFYGTTKKRRMGAMILKANALGENFYFTGRRQLDYLGLEGEILTSFAAVDWVVKRLAKL